jgi:hypothetical protein
VDWHLNVFVVVVLITLEHSVGIRKPSVTSARRRGTFKRFAGADSNLLHSHTHLEPVEFADWAVPIVLVLKADRKSV